MSTRYRIILFVVVAFTIGTWCYVFSRTGMPVYPHGPEWDKIVEALQGLPDKRAKAAVDAYVKEQRKMGRAIPGVVSLDELVKHGFLSTDEVVLFREMTATLRTTDISGCESESFVDVYLPNGHMYAKLADGSIHPAGR